MVGGTSILAQLEPTATPTTTAPIFPTAIIYPR